MPVASSCTLNTDGSGAVAITNESGFDQSPDWQGVANGRSWTAMITGGGLSGRVSLTVPTTGGATVAFSLDRLKAGVSVSARVLTGARCDATARTITRLPAYTTTSGGTLSR